MEKVSITMLMVTDMKAITKMAPKMEKVSFTLLMVTDMKAITKMTNNM